MFFLKRAHAFYGFLISYIFILLIPTAIGVGVYHEISRLVETNEIESNLALLEKAKDTIENRLNEIEHMVLTLRTDPYIWKFSTLIAPPGGSSFYDLYELARHLRLYGSSCRIIHSFYIYFKNSNRIVTMDSSYEPHASYEHNFSYALYLIPIVK